MQSAALLRDATLSVTFLFAILLFVIMQSVAMLSVALLSLTLLVKPLMQIFLPTNFVTVNFASLIKFKPFAFFPVCQIFESKAKGLMKKRTLSLGRIWSVQINSDGNSCGLVAADDKIRIWRQI
jgi:hypothetical protein